MTYAIDEMAPWMWIFVFMFIIIIIYGILRFLYIWVMEDPCRAYRLIASYWGEIGNHCKV